MPARDTGERHRASTPLELLFDLCFVVAVAQCASHLHHAVADADAGSALVSYALVFFAIWWAWMNFTWFASAYDNDDVVYRLLTLVQITGVLVLAAGVPRAFDHRDFDVVFAGYVLMRIGLVSLWLRAARHDPGRRTALHRFAVGESTCLLGWGALALGGWPVWGFIVMGTAELAVPIWAERASATPWHPEHIAERYGLFTLIVLGESILSASVAFQVGIDEHSGSATLYLTAVGALLTVFAMWWIYFAKPAGDSLVSSRVGFLWGYGHFFVFASAAAVGAGIAVVVDSVTHHADISSTGAAAAFTIPVAMFVLTVALIETLLHPTSRTRFPAFVVAAALVLSSTFTGQAVLVTGLVLAALVTAMVVITARSHQTLTNRGE